MGVCKILQASVFCCGAVLKDDVGADDREDALATDFPVAIGDGVLEVAEQSMNVLGFPVSKGV